jgi:hypothetical protein
MKKIASVLALSLLLVIPLRAHAAPTLFKNFDAAPLNQNIFHTSCVTSQTPTDPTNNVGYLTNEYASGGTGMSFKAQVRKTDPICGNSYRTEMHLSITKPEMASAEWIAWETLQPSTQPDDPKAFSSGQVHGSVNVPFSLWFVNNRAQAVLQSSTTGSSANLTVNRVYDLGAFTKGQWHKWIIHFKRSAGADGFLEMWADGVKKFRYEGPTVDIINGTPELNYWAFKFGIYKWSIQASAYDSAVSYTDNVKMGDSTSTLNDFLATPDLTAPTGTLTAPTSGSSVSGTVALSATASDNLGMKAVNFFYDTTLIGSDTSAPYSINWDTSSVASGSHQLKAILIDDAGNTNTTNIATVTVANADLIAPTVALTTPVTGAAVSGTITLAATASDNSGLSRVDFYQGSTLIGSDTTSPYAVTWDTGTVANGSYTLKATAVDLANNTASSTSTVSVSNADTTAPTVAITAPSAGASVAATTTVSATASDNVGVAAVDFYYGTTLIGTDTSAPYSVSWNTSVLANGSYVLKAVARDAAANAGTSGLITVTVANADTTAPNVSLTAPTAGASLNGSVTLSATASDNVAVTSVNFFQGTTLIGTDTSAPYTTVWNTNTVANGSYTLKAIVSDAAGNTGTSSTISVTVANPDTTAPVVAMSAPAAGASVANTISVSATASDNVGVARVDFYYGSTLIASDTSAPYSVSWNTTSLANGSYALKAIATDSSNNQTTSSLITVTVANADTVPPTVTLTAPASGSTVSDTVTISATASDNVGISAVNFFQGTTLISSDTTAPYSVSWNTASVANGSYQVKAIAIDIAGNTNTSSVATVTVNNSTADTIAPTVSLVAPVAGSILAGTTTISASASDNVGVSRVNIYVGTTLMASDTTAPYTASWNTALSTNTTFLLKAVAYDAAGNSATSSYVVTVSNTTTANPIGVTITSPLANTTVSGTIAVTAAVTGTGITKVDFFKDSDSAPFATTASSYTTFLNTTTLANGTHTLRAVAYTASGVSTTSPIVQITVSNANGGGGTTPPTPSAGTPSAPQSVVAQAGYTKAKVSWATPASNGGSAITSYTVTAAPGSKTVTTSSRSATVTGLTNGTTYTFTVRANNTNGAGATSTATTTPTASFVTGSTIAVSVSSNLTVRSTASGTKIGTVANGTVGTVLASSTGWTRVQFPSITGWVSNSYIFAQ